MKKLEKDNVLNQVRDKSFYLYGAGYTAKICIKALREAGVKIDALIDDDTLKQDMSILSYNVMSYEKFAEITANKECVNVILTSIYGKAIYDRLSLLGNVVVWEMYEWYTDILDQQEFAIERHCEGEKLDCYKKNTDELKKYLADMESQNVYDAIYQYFITEDVQKLVDVCTIDESYFIKEVVDYFQDRRFTLVDAGAYTGELLRAIMNSGLSVGKWYCFEVEKNNYEHLKSNLEGNELPEGLEFVCENYGLWSEQKELHVINQGTGSKVVEGADVSCCEICRMLTIDEYFKNIKVDMIKMDIEGAEMEALLGGVQTIKRDTPLLAISIYHYVADYYRIMQFILNNVGDKYKYYIRQHAMIYGETILYAIPCK
ncbi:MAG: FkbM family methyltransferase [Anaeroplasmataceae bacterium]|nr:FkbM family methyltransferase [Anaeroplasmataceae bacterium]